MTGDADVTRVTPQPSGMARYLASQLEIRPMRPAVAIAILAALPFSAALADVYRSVDAQGYVLYSDTPTPGAELVRVTNSQTHYMSTSPASSGTSRSATPPPKSDPSPYASASSRESAAKTV